MTQMEKHQKLLTIRRILQEKGLLDIKVDMRALQIFQEPAHNDITDHLVAVYEYMNNEMDQVHLLFCKKNLENHDLKEKNESLQKQIKEIEKVSDSRNDENEKLKRASDTLANRVLTLQVTCGDLTDKNNAQKKRIEDLEHCLAELAE